MFRSREPFQFSWAATILSQLLSTSVAGHCGKLVSGDCHWSPVYHTDHRHYCTARLGLGSALAAAETC